jgi:hypothetical protein
MSEQQTQNTSYEIKINQLLASTLPASVKTGINKFIEEQNIHVNQITEILQKINNLPNNTQIEIKNKEKLNKYLNYIINIIEIKKKNDDQMITILELVFSRLRVINETIIKFIENQGSVKAELIEIPNDDIKNINEKTEFYKTEITSHFQNCTDELTNKLNEFEKALGQVGGQVGGSNNVRNIIKDNNLIILHTTQKITEHKEKLLKIKKSYEDGLKNNIEGFKYICGELKSLINGYQYVIIERLKKDIKTSAKKYGINLDKLFTKDYPFDDNEKIFTDLKDALKIETANLSRNTRTNNSVNGGPNNINRQEPVSNIAQQQQPQPQQQQQQPQQQQQQQPQQPQQPQESQTGGKKSKIRKSKSKNKQSGGFIRGGVLFPQDFYDTSTVI